MQHDTDTVNAHSFYSEYYGHKISQLRAVCKQLDRDHVASKVFLAGDSSLDNKFWLPHDMRAACNGYERILDPPTMRPDVNYWMNRFLNVEEGSTACVNCAVEESSLGGRFGMLLPQDVFVRDHITENDTLVVSLGGNDIALRPSFLTIINMLLLMKITSKANIAKGKSIFLTHFIKLFGKQVENFCKKLVAKKKPKKIVVCMIYYPDECSTGSWADGVLGHLNYNTDPSKLQTAINTIFELATSTIKIEGTKVVAFPMFRFLDGKTSSHYCARVEPSVKGGQVLARHLVNAVMNDDWTPHTSRIL